MGDDKKTSEIDLIAMDEELSYEELLVKYLRENDFTISTAESCTGGLLTAKIINVPGISEFFKEGFITYSNKAKRKTLDVSKSTIRKEGVISEQTAKEMATGAAMKADTDMAVSVTGNAGPLAEEDKPVGLVYIGIYLKGKVKAFECNFKGTRNEIRAQAADEALKLASLAIKKYLEKKKSN